MPEGQGVAEPNIRQIDVDSPEFRAQSLPRLKDFVRRSEPTIGTTPEQRVAWLTGMQPTAISRFLIDLNGTARGITGIHTFDGEGIQAGTVGASIPPEQSDKEPLLHYAFAETQTMIQQMTADGRSHQEILDRVAVLLPAIVNKLHLFGNGNGRTSRVFRMLIRDGTADADTNIDAIVNKDNINYDASPRPAIDRIITQAIIRQHGTQNIQLEDDIDDAMADDVDIANKVFANLDPDLVRINSDIQNFLIISRDFAKRHNIGVQGDEGKTLVSHRAVLTAAGADAEKKAEFVELYRNVRKERVTVLIDALSGKKDIPIHPEHVIRWINAVRSGRQLPPVANEDVNTVAKGLTASMEAKSPIRT